MAQRALVVWLAIFPAAATPGCGSGGDTGGDAGPDAADVGDDRSPDGQPDTAEDTAEDAAADALPDAPSDGAGDADAGDGSEITPVHVIWYSHNEEASYWENLITNADAYRNYRADLVERIELLASRGVSLSYGCDHAALRAMAAQETPELMALTAGKNVYRWIVEDMGMSPDPHGHLSTYNYADIAHLIEQLGATPTGVIGGQVLLECGGAGSIDVVDWEDVIEVGPDGLVHGRIFPDATWRPLILAQAAMAGHAMDEMSSGIWKPGSGSDFYSHHPEGRITYVGQGYPHDTLLGGSGSPSGTPILYSGAGYVLELAGKIAAGEAPAGRMYTASLHYQDKPTIDPGVATNDGITRVLDVLQPLVDDGRVIYVDYPTAVEIWEEEYGAEPNTLPIEEFSVWDDLWSAVADYCWG